ncbi:metal ABC transporter permease ['Camptotheca acuminata' phytoplasma]|uniref:metal ABC transporter permease n=1 Tax='Camptotheca acuminata' phytoplasma TaxID=3239192 RepID=UPI00351A007E
MNLFDHTNMQVLMGASFLGIAAGILGVFIILKKQSLVGDMASHTVLPGITLLYVILHLLEQNEWLKIKNIDLRFFVILWFGSLISSFIALFLVDMIKKYSKIKIDTILSLILASFFGLGNVMISVAQRHIEDNQIAVLDKFILGQIALMKRIDVITVLFVAIITILIIFLLWKELKIFIFDPEFTKSMGFNTKWLTFILNTLLIFVIVVSLKITGIILTSAFLIIPGVIARQWSDKLSKNVLIASIVIFLSTFIGIIVNNLASEKLQLHNLPTGPIIIVIASIFCLFSLFFGSKHGFVKKNIQIKKYKNQIKKYKQLIHLYHNKDTSESYEFDMFLLSEKYIILENKKPQITQKGKELVEKLIDGMLI